MRREYEATQYGRLLGISISNLKPSSLLFTSSYHNYSNQISIFCFPFFSGTLMMLFMPKREIEDFISHSTGETVLEQPLSQQLPCKMCDLFTISLPNKRPSQIAQNFIHHQTIQ